MYGLMISTREFSSDGPDEDIITPKLRTIPWQKQLETKTLRKHDIQTLGNPGDYIGEN
jgi:hypothetical protein